MRETFVPLGMLVLQGNVTELELQLLMRKKSWF